MNLLFPSAHIQRAIEYDSRTTPDFMFVGKWAHYSVIPTENLDLTPFFAGVTEEMHQFYRRIICEKEFDQQAICDVVWEVLDNARVHGSDNPDALIEFGLFLGKKGTCYAVKDEGDYFKRPEIKKQYEAKERITEFDKKHTSHGYGVNNLVYPGSDIIEVDTDTGTLYCVQLVERLKKKE